MANGETLTLYQNVKTDLGEGNPVQNYFIFFWIKQTYKDIK